MTDDAHCRSAQRAGFGAAAFDAAFAEMPIVANIDFGGRPQDVVSPKSIARTKEILGDAAEVVGFNHMCALAAPPRRCSGCSGGSGCPERSG